MTPPVKPRGSCPLAPMLLNSRVSRGWNSSANRRYSCTGMPSLPGAVPALERFRARHTSVAVTLAAPNSSACCWLSCGAVCRAARTSCCAMGHTWGLEETPAQNLAVSWAQAWGLVWRAPEGERSAGTPRAAAGFFRRCVSAGEGRSPPCSHWRRCCMLASASSAATSAASCWRRCSRPASAALSPASYRSYSCCTCWKAGVLRWRCAARQRWLQSRAAAAARRLSQGHQATNAAASVGALAAAAVTSCWNRWARAASAANCRRSRLTGLRGMVVGLAGRRASVMGRWSEMRAPAVLGSRSPMVAAARQGRRELEM